MNDVPAEHLRVVSASMATLEPDCDHVETQVCVTFDDGSLWIRWPAENWTCVWQPEPLEDGTN